MIGDGDFGEIGGMKSGRGIRSSRRKPTPIVTLSTTDPKDVTMSHCLRMSHDTGRNYRINNSNCM
jgi:hypothetical protein